MSGTKDKRHTIDRGITIGARIRINNVDIPKAMRTKYRKQSIESKINKI